MRRRAAVWILPLSLTFVLGTGTVKSQRDRLPPAAECPDDIEGTWASHDHNPQAQYWVQHTLFIERGEQPNSLVGRATARTWKGGSELVQPPPCTGRRHYAVSYDGKGSLVGDEFRFAGYGGWTLERQFCGRNQNSYNIDSFVGTLNTEIDELQVVNNDGGSAVNRPTVFRRVQCGTAAMPFTPIQPLPQPPQTTTGWSCASW